MEYLILKSKSSVYSFGCKELEKKVNDKIKEGWKPQGGVNIFYDKVEYEYRFSQAVIKEK